MNNPIELRGSHVMINEIVKNKTQLLVILKWLLGILAFGFLIHFPDAIGHGIVWLIHTFYEATSFVLEEFITHSFGLDKSLAQLMVFYFSIFVGIGTTALIWRHILKDYLVIKLHTYKQQAFEYWYSMRTAQKIKLIIIHSALMISAFMFFLT